MEFPFDCLGDLHQETWFTVGVSMDTVSSQLWDVQDKLSDPELIQIARYHLSTGGKQFRSKLAQAAGQYFQLQTPVVQIWALVCELVHQASLVHDDLQDGDTHRRGHQSVWFKYGAAQAVNLGDAWLILPYQILAQAKISEDVRSQFLDEVSKMSLILVAGQSAEFQWKNYLDQDSASLKLRYDKIVDQKTGALISSPVMGMARASGMRLEDQEKLRDDLQIWGRCFQACDDLLDFFPEKGRSFTGRDLQEGKVTSVLLEYLEQPTKLKSELREFLKKDRLEVTQQEIQFWRNEIMSSGIPWLQWKKLQKNLELALHQMPQGVLADLLQEAFDQMIQPIRQNFETGRYE